MIPPFAIAPAGDAALVVQGPERIDPAVNAWCVALAADVRHAAAGVVTDVVVGFCSVTVYFDPIATDARWLEQELARLAGAAEAAADAQGALVEVPVCYGGAYGPDLPDVAAFGGLPEEEVIGRHAAREYRVYLLGFVPGFAYLAEVDPAIAAPRRRSPRTRVPAGSVGVAGPQTGIYPAETPGGWNIIGRTPIRPCDPARSEPFLFHPGDRVRFRSVTADEFAVLAEPCPPSA